MYVCLEYQSKVWIHFLIQGFFFFFYYFLHCRIIVKTSKLWNNTWNYVVTKKSVKQFKVYFIFYILHSSHPLPWWQLCTLLAFSQPASWGSHQECQLSWDSNILRSRSSITKLDATAETGEPIAVPNICRQCAPSKMNVVLFRHISSRHKVDANGTGTDMSMTPSPMCIQTW